MSATTTTLQNKNRQFKFDMSNVPQMITLSDFRAQLPCIMWLALYKPKRFSLSWITNWVS